MRYRLGDARQQAVEAVRRASGLNLRRHQEERAGQCQRAAARWASSCTGGVRVEVRTMALMSDEAPDSYPVRVGGSQGVEPNGSTAPKSHEREVRTDTEILRLVRL